MLVQSAHAVVRHQDLHLALWQVLDLFVLGPVLAFFALCRAHALLESLEAEELLPNHRLRSPRDRVLGGCTDEISRSFFVLGAQSDLRIWRRRNVLFEPLSNLEQLRKTLHREQECRIGSPRGVENLAEVLVTERRKL